MELMYMLMINLVVLVALNFLVLMERKILGLTQIRKGPNKSLAVGLAQSLMDAMKLFLKSLLTPLKSNSVMFFLSPVVMLLISLGMWTIVPYRGGVFDLDFSLIYFMVLLSVSVFPFIISGWASNSKYSFLGSMRAVAQIISYEISMIILLICVVILSGSYSVDEILFFQSEVSMCYVFNFLIVLMLVSVLAELSRTPFDFAEGESELVSGFNVEFGGILFTLMFLSEYANILIMSSFMIIMFFGVDLMMAFFLKVSMMSVLIILIRGVLPRYRYDMLMNLAWKKILPLSLGLFLIMIFMKIILM